MLFFSFFNVCSGGIKYGFGMDSFTPMMIFNSAVFIGVLTEIFLRVTKFMDKLCFEFKCTLFWEILYLIGFITVFITHIFMIIQFQKYDKLVYTISLFGLFNCVFFFGFIIQNALFLLIDGLVLFIIVLILLFLEIRSDKLLCFLKKECFVY